MQSSALKGFALGFGLLLATQGAWQLLATHPENYGMGGGECSWVMYPTSGIVTALLIHFVGSLLFWMSLHPGPGATFAFIGGVASCSAIMMLVTCPGNLWPLVLVIDWVLLDPAVAGGLLAGRLLQR